MHIYAHIHIHLHTHKYTHAQTCRERGNESGDNYRYTLTAKAVIMKIFIFLGIKDLQ